MKNEKLGSRAAFPMMYDNPGCRGMSKRFYAACAALKSPLLRADDLCDDDMVEDVGGAYIKNTSGSYLVTQWDRMGQKYSIKPEVTEIKRIIRYASKLVDELLTQENEQR